MRPPAARRLALPQDYNAGWILDPIYTGDWTPSRKAVLGSALPTFTPDQQRLLLDSRQDVLALQHYTGRYTRSAPDTPPFNASECTGVGLAGLGWAGRASGL